MDRGIYRQAPIKMKKMTFSRSQIPARVIAVLMLLLPGMVCCDRGGPPQGEPGKVLARIDGETVTVEEFEEALARGAEKLPRIFSGSRKGKRVLHHLVDEEVVYATALEEGYGEDPEMVRVMRQAIVGKYLARNLKPRLENVTVSDEEISGHYQQNLDRYRTHEMVRAAVISVKIPSGIDDAGKRALLDRARAALEEARGLPAGTAGFGELAARYSDDKRTRESGGDIGWIVRGPAGGGLHPALHEAVMELDEPGALTPVVETPRAFYVGRLMKIKPSHLRALSMVRSAVKEFLLRQARDAAREAFYGGLRKGREITIDEELLEQVEKAAAPRKTDGAGAGEEAGASSPGTLRRAIEKLGASE